MNQFRRLSQQFYATALTVDDEVRRLQADGYFVSTKKLYGKRRGQYKVFAIPLVEEETSTPIPELDAFFAPAKRNTN